MKFSKPKEFRLNRDSPLAYGLQLWLPLSDGRLVDRVRGIVFTPSASPPLMASTEFGPARRFLSGSNQYLLSSLTPITAVPLTIACWYATGISTGTRELVGIYNSTTTTDFFQLQQAGSVAYDPVRARTGDSGGTSNGESATGGLENIFGLGVARFAAVNSRVATHNLGGKGTSTATRTPAGLDRISVGTIGGSSISTYFNGWISDICIWNRSLSDAEVYRLYDPATRWELYDPIVRWWAVKATGGPTVYDQAEAGSVTPAGATNKATSKTWAGTITPSGVDVKRTSKDQAGTLTPTGILASIRIIINAVSGTMTTAGNLARSTGKTLVGTLTSAGTDVKQTSKTQAGTVTPAGALVKRTGKALAGALTPAGSLAKRIAKLLAGALTTAGALATEKQAPAVASVFFTLAPRVTQFTLAAGRSSFTLAERSRDFTVSAGRQAFTLAKRVISFTVQDK